MKPEDHFQGRGETREDETPVDVGTSEVNDGAAKPTGGSRRFLRAVTVDQFEAILENALLDGQLRRVDAIETARVRDALHRVAGGDIRSPINVPRFPKSRVDGYALRAEGTFGASDESPVELRVVGSVEMGKLPANAIKANDECIYVPTGGAIPGGADAVIKVEFTSQLGSGKIEIYKSLVPGSGMIQAGDDLKENEVIIKKGKYLEIPDLGSLSAAGIVEIPVYKRLNVGLFSTGDELVAPGNELGLGKIYDVNSLIIQKLLEDAGCEVVFHGIVPDDEERLSALFKRMLEIHDAILCSGGTSKGKGDLMPAIIENHPGTTLFIHGVRIKPGKPLIFAIADGKPVIVLPGNPTSAMMTQLRLINPLARQMNRAPLFEPPVVHATLSERIYSELGRRELKAVVLKTGGGEQLMARPMRKGSETITTLLNTDGYFEVPENVEIIEKGDEVEVKLFHPREFKTRAATRNDD